MKVRMLPFDRQLHQQLMSGQRKAIAWGVSGVVYYQLLQSPYPFVAIIDGLNGDVVGSNILDISVVGPDELAKYDVDDVVIVIFSDIEKFGPDIIQQIKSYGDYCYVAPYVESICEPSDALNNRLQDLVVLQRGTIIHQPISRVVLYIHSLVKGGAERQMVLLALGLRELGWDVHLVSAKNLSLKVNHWEDILLEHGVHLHFVPTTREYGKCLFTNKDSYELASRLACYFDPMLLHGIITAYECIRKIKPRVAISYLEDGNVISSMAAIFSGVEHIVMSGRCVAPPELPKYLAIYDEPELRFFYQWLSHMDRVVLSVNSCAGAHSYARWLDLPLETFPVVKNAVLTESVKAKPVNDLGIDPSSKILMGVMRLSPEKSPCNFIDVVTSVLEKEKDAHVILIGDGPLRQAVLSHIATKSCSERIHWVGVQDNIFEWLSCASVLISTSSHEGMSNVILESQAIGCPVVATDIPGNRETLLPLLVEAGCLISHGQWQQMSARVLALLRRSQIGLSQRLQQEMLRHYSPRRLAEQTLALCSL